MNKRDKNRLRVFRILQSKNKKGISIMVGYILLVSISVVMGIIVYSTLKTYVPLDPPTCPAEVSVLVKEYSCVVDTSLDLTIKNNGRFSIAGYFIHISNNANDDIATTDISQYASEGGIAAGGAVIFVAAGDNPLAPTGESKVVYDLSNFDFGTLKLIDIIPARYQEIDGVTTFVSCGNARISEEINDASCSFSTNPVN